MKYFKTIIILTGMFVALSCEKEQKEDTPIPTIDYRDGLVGKYTGLAFTHYWSSSNPKGTRRTYKDTVAILIEPGSDSLIRYYSNENHYQTYTLNSDETFSDCHVKGKIVNDSLYIWSGTNGCPGTGHGGGSSYRLEAKKI